MFWFLLGFVLGWFAHYVLWAPYYRRGMMIEPKVKSIAFLRSLGEYREHPEDDAVATAAQWAADEIKRLKTERDNLLALCEHINHALWPDPDASHDTEEAPAEIERLRAENGLRKRFMDGLPFCPDHRDKVKGKACRECEIERLRADIANAVSQSREACPDYPWDDSLPSQASQAAWAVTQSLGGVTAANEDLHVLVAKLPKTADGVRVVPGMVVWVKLGDIGLHPVVASEVSDNGQINIEDRAQDDDEGNFWRTWEAVESFSTREAAEAAKGG